MGSGASKCSRRPPFNHLCKWQKAFSKGEARNVEIPEFLREAAKKGESRAPSRGQAPAIWSHLLGSPRLPSAGLATWGQSCPCLGVWLT